MGGEREGVETHFSVSKYMTVYVDVDHHSKILLDIAHISFPKLKCICFYNHTNIQSIEVLASMWMPSLARVALGTC